MIQLLTASTLFQVASLATMVDAGALPAPDGERVLLLVDGSQQPELTGSIADAAGFGDLAARFDRVVDFGQLLLPRRPAQFNPREEELYLWRRLLRRCFHLGEEELQLVVDSIQTNPTRAILRIFHDSPFLVHSDGLMSYGPTRNLLPASIHQRLDGLLYLDLRPGLKPLLLREFAPQLIPMPPQPLADIINGLARSTLLVEPVPVGALSPAVTSKPKTALVLGQYLAHLGLMDDEEERVLHREMLREAERLSPYENSNRIPVTLIDALFRRGLPLPIDDSEGSEGPLMQLVTAVVYCMQPLRLAEEEEATREFLAGHYPRFAKYFKRRRLTRLDLPGSLPTGAAASGLAAQLKRRVPARVHRRLNRGIPRMPRPLLKVATRVQRG